MNYSCIRDMVRCPNCQPGISRDESRTRPVLARRRRIADARAVNLGRMPSSFQPTVFGDQQSGLVAEARARRDRRAIANVIRPLAHDGRFHCRGERLIPVAAKASDDPALPTKILEGDGNGTAGRADFPVGSLEHESVTVCYVDDPSVRHSSGLRAGNPRRPGKRHGFAFTRGEGRLRKRDAAG